MQQKFQCPQFGEKYALKDSKCTILKLYSNIPKNTSHSAKNYLCPYYVLGKNYQEKRAANYDQTSC